MCSRWCLSSRRAGGGWVRRTLPDTGARVTAVGASVLLDVKRATTLGIRQHSCSFILQFFSVRAYRSVCTGRASCCGACQSWTFPSLFTHSVSLPCLPPCNRYSVADAYSLCRCWARVTGRVRRYRRRWCKVLQVASTCACDLRLSKSLAEVGELVSALRQG